MQKKIDKMKEVDAVLAEIRQMVSDSMYEGIESTPDADYLQETALEMVRQAVSAYIDQSIGGEE
ncbi:MAG TPA: hypothetical protein PKV43_14405 [Armatimonadota bacterium]|nr:hypothetical protein [Armatimonadota bacterium]